MLSASGLHVSATCISPEAAAYLSSHSDLLPHHVSSREVYADTTSSLLNEGGRIRARIVKTNAVKSKLDFVLQVVQQYITNEGLGRLDEDAGVGSGVDDLCWNGLTVKDGSKKVDRVTVGRFGGDEGIRQASR